MSGNIKGLAIQPEDVSMMLAANVHIGCTNINFQMEQYVFKRRNDGIHLIDIRKTWEKLLLAARAIAAVENPADVCIITNKAQAQRAILKFAAHTGASPIAGRFTPGTFTNQIQTRTFREPRLLVLTDPRLDHQPITEASYVNIPTIAFCNTDSPLRYLDIAIPCNNKSNHGLGLMLWMLAREVQRIRGSISRTIPWDVMVDLYFHREAEETEKDEAEGAVVPEGKTKEGNTSYVENPGDFTAPMVDDNWEVIQVPAPTVVQGNQDGNVVSAPKPAELEDWGNPSTSW